VGGDSGLDGSVRRVVCFIGLRGGVSRAGKVTLQKLSQLREKSRIDGSGRGLKSIKGTYNNQLSWD